MSAPLEKVWALLQDIPRLASFLPGVSDVTELGPDTYAAELIVKVGPIKSAFRGEAVIVERKAPDRVVAEIQGQDRATHTSVRADFVGELAGVEDGTRLEYSVDIALRGRLAQFGTAVINATAKRMTADFAEKLREELER